MHYFSLLCASFIISYHSQLWCLLGGKLVPFKIFSPLEPSLLLLNSPVTLQVVLHITMCQGQVKDDMLKQLRWVQCRRETLDMSKPWKPNSTILFPLARLYLYNPIILVSMCEGASWLAEFNSLHSRHIGCGSDACRLLMINEFHHCHSGTMVT